MSLCYRFKIKPKKLLLYTDLNYKVRISWVVSLEGCKSKWVCLVLWKSPRIHMNKMTGFIKNFQTASPNMELAFQVVQSVERQTADLVVKVWYLTRCFSSRSLLDWSFGNTAMRLSNLARSIFLVYNTYNSSGPQASYPVGTKGSFPGSMSNNSCSVELIFYLHLVSR